MFNCFKGVKDSSGFYTFFLVFTRILLHFPGLNRDLTELLLGGNG